ncbi:hypothetical protein AcW1_005454 [Taiwanofungus camphoratus]|nr:hypothetical protein AcW1_005454 [Antrodia cinnamomea]
MPVLELLPVLKNLPMPRPPYQLTRQLQVTLLLPPNHDTYEHHSVSVESGSAAFRPSRRVRTAPGGKHTDIFGTDDDDVLASAPPRGEVEAPQAVVDSKVDLQPTTEEKPTAAVYETAQEARPKSKRTTSSVASLWDAHDSPDQFKPTRRVREMPGGKDSISGLF